MKARDLIDKLRGRGVSKWKISKELGVHWNTVHAWHKGMFSPTEDKIKKLQELCEKLL